MIENRGKKDNGIFIIGMMIFAFSNIFAISGYAYSLSYNQIATIAALVVLLFFVLSKYQQKGGLIAVDFVAIIACFIYLLLALFSWESVYQLTNIVTLFAMPLWVKIFSAIKWDKSKYFWVGGVMSAYSIFMIFMFLPGSLLSGWNTNSSICIIPTLFFGLTCLKLSEHKWKTWFILIIALAAIYLLLQLENRSAFLALILFLVMLFFDKLHQNKIVFRVFYIAIIAFNVLLPLFFEFATEMRAFEVVSDWLMDVFDKSGLNGREDLWALAIKRIDKRPWFGTLGYRTTYFHNFSLDILTQFGWIGWIVYIASLIFILERGFEENNPKNLFLIGFLCLIFLNTFESVLFANNYFMPFTYLLLGICWGTTKKKTIDKKVFNKEDGQ